MLAYSGGSGEGSLQIVRPCQAPLALRGWAAFFPSISPTVEVRER